MQVRLEYGQNGLEAELPDKNLVGILKLTPAPPLPDHTQLPDEDGAIVHNFEELKQSMLLTDCLEPVLERLHPDGRYCIGQDTGIYWRLPAPAEPPGK